MIALALALQLTLSSVRVVDGDTLHDNRRQEDYRLAGIDAPETGGRAACEREAALGEMARARVEDLIAGADLVVAIPDHDPRGRKRWPVDGFKRRLARIEVDGQDVGQILVAEYLAVIRDPDRPFDWCDGAEPR